MKQTVTQAIATTVTARRNCINTGNGEWQARWSERLKQLERNALPSGSGFDSGTTIDIDRTTDRRIVLHTSFHHMTEHGYYDGWTEHTVTADATFSGFDIRVSGRNRNGIKEYIADTMHAALSQPWEWSA